MSEIVKLKESLSARLRGDWPTTEAVEALARAIAREVAAEVYEARARFGDQTDRDALLLSVARILRARIKDPGSYYDKDDIAALDEALAPWSAAANVVELPSKSATPPSEPNASGVALETTAEERARWAAAGPDIVGSEGHRVLRDLTRLSALVQQLVDALAASHSNRVNGPSSFEIWKDGEDALSAARAAGFEPRKGGE